MISPLVRITLICGLLGALGCGSKAAEPAASGSLVFDPKPPDTADVFLATEAEVIRSAQLRERVAQDLRMELTADAIVVARKRDSMILEIGVRDADARRAAQLCNALARAYLEHRLERGSIDNLRARQAIAEQLERHPDDENLRNRMSAMEMERAMQRLDVRLLEACTPRNRD